MSMNAPVGYDYLSDTSPTIAWATSLAVPKRFIGIGSLILSTRAGSSCNGLSSYAPLRIASLWL